MHFSCSVLGDCLIAISDIDNITVHNDELPQTVKDHIMAYKSQGGVKSVIDLLCQPVRSETSYTHYQQACRMAAMWRELPRRLTSLFDIYKGTHSRIFNFSELYIHVYHFLNIFSKHLNVRTVHYDLLHCVLNNMD